MYRPAQSDKVFVKVVKAGTPNVPARVSTCQFSFSHCILTSLTLTSLTTDFLKLLAGRNSQNPFWACSTTFGSHTNTWN